MSLDIKAITEVPGLYYISNIQDLSWVIDILDNNDKWSSITNSDNSRKVQHFGYIYNYFTFKINEKTEDFPDYINKFAELLTCACLYLKIPIPYQESGFWFNQCIINNYFPSQGIPKHTDIRSYGGVIGCFTIGSGGSMVFKNPDNNEKFELYTEPNSLYIMTGDSRYKWTHEMPLRKNDQINNIKIPRGRRISITFRNVPSWIL